MVPGSSTCALVARVTRSDATCGPDPLLADADFDFAIPFLLRCCWTEMLIPQHIHSCNSKRAFQVQRALNCFGNVCRQKTRGTVARLRWVDKAENLPARQALRARRCDRRMFRPP